MTQMKVVLENYGPVTVDIEDTRQRSDVGAYFGVIGHFIGPQAATDEKRIEESDNARAQLDTFEGHTIDGTIVGGPFDGEEIEGEPLEIDPDIIEGYAETGDLPGDPYEEL